MKYIYLPILMFSLLVTSCSDFLDRSPSTSLPVDESIASLNDLQYAVNGVYYLNTRYRMSYGGDFAIYADMKGGDFVPIGNNNHVATLARYTTTQDDIMPDEGWYYFYKSIANVNKALEAADNLEITNSEQAEFNQLVGELYALRAMLHFDLARIFCQAPTAADNVDAENSGIPIADAVYEPDYKPARATLRQTYGQILDDLEMALPLLTKDLRNGYINYWAALALRARVNLYNGDNGAALSDAQAVISGSPYRLYTRDNYLSVWENEYTSESLLEIKITTNYNAQRNSVGYYCSGTGYGETGFDTTGELFAYLTGTPEDIRSGLVDYQDATAEEDVTYTGYYPAKYPGREGNIYVNNPKLIRLADVYLIAAEAALKSGGDAVSYINTLRSNRIEGYQPVNSISLEEILFERRIELFAENSTSFDYFRNKLSIQSSLLGEVKYNNYAAILPIPTAEMEANPNMKQNPGYAND